MAETAVNDLDKPKPGPFILSDAMILIIALALGFAEARPFVGESISLLVWKNHLWTWGRIVFLGGALTFLVKNFLFYLMSASLIIRLKRPHPPWRSMVCQPGFAACAAPVSFYFTTLPLALLVPLPLRAAGCVMIGCQFLLVAAAPLALVYLIATRRWEPEPSWIDRLGCVLAALWMVSALAFFVLMLLHTVLP